MPLTELELEPIIKRNCWSKLRKKKRVELEIKNSGHHLLQIFSVPTDLDKIEVEYLETDNGKTEVSYPIVIQENESKKLGIAIKSSLKEWLWSGIDLSNILVSIYANTTSDPKKSEVFTGEAKIKSARIFWISLVTLIILGGIALFAFFRQPEQDIVISSYPHGQTVYIEGKPVGTTPTWLKVKEKATIKIGDLPQRSVKEVLEDGLIFYRSEKEENQNER